MRNRLSKCSKHLAFVTCMLALGGSFSACQDEYYLDEEKPTWLNTSIYETLESSGIYKNYLRLIEDPDVNVEGDENASLKEILKRTGSKTVFVADDQAWDEFFNDNKSLAPSNPWHTAQSYDQLTKNQKKLLLHSSMLNNAIVMENISSSSGSKPVRGSYLRRENDVEIVDSISCIPVADLFKSKWSAERQTSEENKEHFEVDQWSRIRNGEQKREYIYLVQDNSRSMMLQFTNEFMKKNSITDEDFAIIAGQERKTGDIHINSNRLDSADIVCENGYVNKTQRPIVPLANMAEVLRTNGKTHIFSHMLERFSVPLQNTTEAKIFSRLYPEKFKETDTLYTKRYYSKRSFGGAMLDRNDRGEKFAGTGAVLLKFDPGWNGYYPADVPSSQMDMGAMIVPSDDQMLHFFKNDGASLIQEYALNPSMSYDISNLDKLYEDIDQIPLEKIEKIINHCMQESFVNSVPSKMPTLREDITLEQLYTSDDVKAITDVFLACNGVVYVMDKVKIPADFRSVATPAFLRSTNKIMFWAIYTDQNATGLNLHYYAYLKSMQSRFSFFMPSDVALGYYYDPMSFSSAQPRMLKFKYFKPANDNGFPVSTELADEINFAYDINTGEIGACLLENKYRVTQGDIKDRLRQILEGSTIVHAGQNIDINNDVNEYYVAKNGMGIKVEREGGKVVRAQGGFQIENQRAGLSATAPGIIYCNVDLNEQSKFDNGYTFTMDAPLIPASRSVFGVLSNMPRGLEGDESKGDLADQTSDTNPFYEFFKLCNGYDEFLVLRSGLVDESKYNKDIDKDMIAKQRALDLYKTFVSDKTVDQRVQFFNNYNYTILAPSNEAILAAVELGLPTWETIDRDYRLLDDDPENDTDLEKDLGNLTTKEDSLNIQAKIIYLTNFVRSHFVDKSYFADKSTMSEEDVFSSSFSRETGMFVKHKAKRDQSGVLSVNDTYGGNWINSISESHQLVTQNIMTCDRELSGEVKKSANKQGNLSDIKLDGASYAVVHLIDGVLNFKELRDGRYENFEDVMEARRFIKQFEIR